MAKMSLHFKMTAVKTLKLQKQKCGLFSKHPVSRYHSSLSTFLHPQSLSFSQPKFLTPMAVIPPIGQPTKPTDKVCQITPVLITNYHAAPDMSA